MCISGHISGCQGIGISVVVLLSIGIPVVVWACLLWHIALQYYAGSSTWGRRRFVVDFMMFFSSNSLIIFKEMDVPTIIGKESADTLEHTNAHAVHSRLTLNYSK